jgi:hypothetical protein
VRHAEGQLAAAERQMGSAHLEMVVILVETVVVGMDKVHLMFLQTHNLVHPIQAAAVVVPALVLVAESGVLAL